MSFYHHPQLVNVCGKCNCNALLLDQLDETLAQSGTSPDRALVQTTLDWDGSKWFPLLFLFSFAYIKLYQSNSKVTARWIFCSCSLTNTVNFHPSLCKSDIHQNRARIHSSVCRGQYVQTRFMSLIVGFNLKKKSHVVAMLFVWMLTYFLIFVLLIFVFEKMIPMPASSQ